MSAAERNRYVSPLQQREGASVSPNPNPRGTFGTAARFGAPSQPGERARSPSWGYGLGTRGAAATNPGRRGGYAELAQARLNQAQGATTPARRSKTPAASRPSSAAAVGYAAVPGRRATTPPPRTPPLYSTPYTATVDGVVYPSRRTMPAVPSSAPSRQRPTTPGGERAGLASNRTTTPRTPSRTLQGPARSTAHSPPPSSQGSAAATGSGRRFTAPTRTGPSTSRARRLAYGNDSPFAAPRAANPAAAAAAGGSAASPGAGLPLTISSVRPTAAGAGGRFQEPRGDDWLSDYERSSMGLLQELERIVGGFSSQLGSLAPAPMEAGAPPMPLPTAAADERAAAPSDSRVQRPVANASVGPSGSTGAGNNVFGNAGQSAWGALHATGARRSAWDEATGPAQVQAQGPPAAAPLQAPAVGLTYSYMRPAAAGAGAGSSTANAAAAAPLTLASPTSGSPFLPSGPAGPKRSRLEYTGAAAQPQLQLQPPPAAAPQTQPMGAGQAAPPAPVGVPSGTIAELWGVLQACSSTTTRLMADLAAARREVELANARAEEADSLARTFQRQLEERQEGVAALQKALAEVEEREAAARQQLAAAQERCNEQAVRARQAEHVAATVQLRLERLMQQQAGQQAEASQAGETGGGSGGRPSGVAEEPDPKVQQQLEALQADLAAAQTRATRAELELAVARNKALLAQQEMSAEEERARRAVAAATAARRELGRTRSALEMMGRDHDRLQSQLAEIGDVAQQRPLASSRPDLLAPADQGVPVPPATRAATAPSHQWPGATAAPLPQRHTETGASSRADTSRWPAANQPSAARGASGAVGSPAPGGSGGGRVAHATATPASGGAVERPRHRLSNLSPRGAAIRGPSDDSGCSGGGSDEGADPSLLTGPTGNTDDEEDDVDGSTVVTAAAQRDGALSPARRRRRGSLLLLPPSEMPADTTASARYGHRMVLRRHSRSQDLGLVISPRRGGAGAGGLAGPQSPLGGNRSPRNLSGSHDGVVRRLNLADNMAGDHGGSTTEDEAPEEKASGSGATAESASRAGAGRRNGGGDGSDDGSFDGTAAARGGGGAGGGATLLGTAGRVTEEMLPLSRTPSSGARRRFPSLRISQVGSSRDAPLPLPTRAAAAVVSLHPPSEGLAAVAPPGAEPARLQRMPSSGRAPAAPERGEPQAPGAAAVEQPPRGISARGALSSVIPSSPYAQPEAHIREQQQQPNEQQQQQPGQLQQQRGAGGQAGLSVSLADLRRQMAAATAAAAAVAGTPDAPPAAAAPRQRVTITSLAPAPNASPAAAPFASAAAPAGNESNRPMPPRPLSQQTPSLAPQPVPRQTELSRQQSQPPPPPRSVPPVAGAAAPGRSSSLLQQARSALPDLLPPLEPSSSPPERPRAHGRDADGAPPRSPLATPGPGPGPGSTPQHRPSHGTITAAAAASAPQPHRAPSTPVATAAAAAAPPSRLAGPPVPPRLLGPGLASSSMAAADTSPPQGFSTSHLNGLYESTRWSLKFGTAAPPPPQARSQDKTGAPPSPPPAAAAAGSSGASPVVGTGKDALGLMDGRHLALTPRSRMLSPSQLDSFLVSPSVTNSMAAVASIDGHLPAAATATDGGGGGALQRQLQQQRPQQQQPVPSPLRGAGVAERQSPAASQQPAASSPASQSAATTAAALAAGSNSSRVAGMAPSPQSQPRSPGPGQASAPAGTGSGPSDGAPQHRRPWWQRLLPPRPRRQRPEPRTDAPPRSQSTPGAAALAAMPGTRSPAGGGSPSRLRPSDLPSHSPRALARGPADNISVGPPGSVGPPSAAATGARAVAGAAASTSSGLKSSPQPRSRNTGGGGAAGVAICSGGGAGASGSGGGGGRLLRTVLVHLGMWSGGMALGVLLVLGAAGIVEGTLGLGAAAGAGGGAGGLPPGVAACACPPPQEQRKRAGGGGGGSARDR